MGSELVSYSKCPWFISNRSYLSLDTKQCQQAPQKQEHSELVYVLCLECVSDKRQY
jgi:hypothetical protein